MAKLDHSAFSPDDVDDAKRGYPDFDLRAFASQRGLEFLDHGTPTGYRAAVPCEEELQSNVLRGTMPGGAYGVLAHEGLMIPWSTDSSDWGGTFYHSKVKMRGSLIPIVGDAPKGSTRVPCTIAGVRVPETSGVHPYLRIDTRRSSSPWTFTNRTKLDALGLKGWSVWCEPEPTPETVERLVAEPVADLLRRNPTFDNGLFQIVVWWGTLVVRRNGFLRPEGVDELAHSASTVAEQLRRVCVPLAEPRPFDTKLPTPPSDGLAVPMGFHPGEEWRTRATAFAERHGLALESPFAYHRAFPSLPVPGTAYVVLRGEIPHVGSGRLVVHRERDDARPAVVTAVPPGAEPTPPGGVAFPEQAARLEVADGLLAVWGTQSWNGYALMDQLEEFCAAAGTVIERSRTSPADR